MDRSSRCWIPAGSRASPTRGCWPPWPATSAPASAPNDAVARWCRAGAGTGTLVRGTPGQSSVGTENEMAAEHVDVLIVGAGLSGIGAACHLRRRSPGKTFAILESRDTIGGTWDLFRYPGVRSDSDMFTMGYGFRPWTAPDAVAAGATILGYVRDTA